MKRISIGEILRLREKEDRVEFKEAKNYSKMNFDLR